LSRRHAAIVRIAGGWEIHDLGSKNGTTVNGTVTDRGELADGDLIELGSTFLGSASTPPAAS